MMTIWVQMQSRVTRRSDDLFEIPFKDEFKTFNREQLNKMILTFEKAGKAKNVENEDGAPGTSRMVEEDLEIVPRNCREHRERKSSFNRGRGRGSGHRGSNAQDRLKIEWILSVVNTLRMRDNINPPLLK